jgi:uncharacterized membrane protein
MAEAVHEKGRRARRDVEDAAPQNAIAEQSNADEQRDEPTPGQDGGRSTLSSELRDTIREAAIEVLRPVARKATTSAAKYAVTRGPDMVKDKVMPKVTEAGGAGALAKGALSKGGGLAEGLGGKLPAIGDKLPGIGGKGKGGKAPSGTGRGRRLPVQEHIDVGVPIDVAYDQWTQFEEWPRFMHRVEKIEQRDDTTLMWHENIWGVRRSWEAEIVEQEPCERIVWRARGGTQTVGVVTFHKLAENLTRIQVNLDFQPQGVFEKAASGMRLSRRALRSDLMRFKAYVEMHDEATGQWRGRIEEGEVVEGPEGGDEPEGREEHDEPEGREEPVGEESEDEDEPRDEDEERPRKRGRFTSKSEDDEEPSEEDDEEEEFEDEPVAEEDEAYAEEDEDEEEEPEEKPRPKRTRAASGSGRRAK